MSDAPVLLLLALAALGILVAAALSAGEVAITRISRAGLAELEASSPARAARARLLAEDPGAAAAAAMVRVVGEMLAAASITLALTAAFDAWWLVFVVALVVTVVIAVVLVRLSPRSAGRDHPVAVLGAVGGLMVAVLRLTRPLHGLYAIRGTPARIGGLSEDEIRDIVERVSEAPSIEADEREMLRSVFELGETLTRAVMVPRTEMVTVARGTTLRKAQSLFLRSGYSRIPVVGESVDDLLGVCYFKDVARRLHADPELGGAPVESVMRPAVFVPESKPVDDLLAEMQKGSFHIAMVVDEYGGIAGLVTLEDALEEIVGELTDEHDRSGPEVEALGDGAFRVPSRLSIDDLGDLFGLEVEDDDVDSAGGLLAKALGKVPIPGSEATTHGVRIVAERTQGRRKQVATLVVRRAEPAEEEVDADERAQR